MAMNKSEAARMEALERARDLARALRWPEGAPPERLTTPEAIAARCEERTLESRWGTHAPETWRMGWFARADLVIGQWSLSVVRVYSRSHGHFTLREEEPEPKRVPDSTSQGHGEFYATREDALLAARFRATEEVAGLLLLIDNARANTGEI